MFKKILTSIFFLLYVQNSFASKQIFSLDEKTLLAEYERFDTNNSDNESYIIKTKYWGTNKELLVEEEGHFENNILKKYSIHQLQQNKQGEILFNGDLILFKFTDSSNKSKNATEVAKPSTMAPLALIKFIENNMEQLKKGATIPLRIAVWDRLETVGMELSLTKEAPYKTPNPTLLIKMKPSAFIIAQLVDPFFFEVDPQTNLVKRMRGRLPIKEKQKNNKWKDLDGFLVTR